MESVVRLAAAAVAAALCAVVVKQHAREVGAESIRFFSRRPATWRGWSSFS